MDFFEQKIANSQLMRLCICVGLLALVFSAGCSKESGASLEGKVTYGGEPIDVGTITFIPASGSGVKGGGLIESGSYKVDSKIGLGTGPHRVEIRWAKGTGKKSKNEFGEEIQRRAEGLPEKYHNQSGLTAEIKPGKNVIDFDLAK
jgi:hypothetical protein